MFTLSKRPVIFKKKNLVKLSPSVTFFKNSKAFVKTLMSKVRAISTCMHLHFLVEILLLLEALVHALGLVLDLASTLALQLGLLPVEPWGPAVAHATRATAPHCSGRGGGKGLSMEAIGVGGSPEGGGGKGI